MSVSIVEVLGGDETRYFMVTASDTDDRNSIAEQLFAHLILRPGEAIDIPGVQEVIKDSS